MPTEPSDDPDYGVLAAESADLSAHYSDDGAAWVGSPFEWIRHIPSRSKGAVGEVLVERWALTRGFEVRRSPSSEADRVINGHRVEIKLSTRWGSGGYRFQQIRDQAYDFCLCLGLSPFETHAWLLPKRVLHERVIGWMGQHTGASGADTAWLGFPVHEPFDWMRRHGDRLDDVARLLADAGTGRW